ncbi:EAL domain-containing protein [Ligilactobacillus equi]|uniref:EAL domain-containing protein n=1 Tax=Ligilactobacillus equi TaxID=137357 RepID=UPI002ED1851D
MKKQLNMQEKNEWIISHLDQALEEGWIKHYHQPIVNTLTSTLVGTEVLARWEDPEMGMLYPGDFIPVLENNHLIYKLDIYTVRKMCAAYAEVDWQKDVVLPFSFNLSRQDFIYCDIYEEIEAAVRKYDVPRDFVHIEITESMFTDPATQEKIRETVSLLRKTGYTVWMDDFGSGYSSLNFLKDFFVDELKLDRDFLTNFSQRSQDIVTSVVDMAKKLGIHVLAEGVETKEQFDFLRKIGCEQVQGYYFGAPMPWEECLENCRRQGLVMSSRMQNAYLSQIGKVNFVTDSAISLVEMDFQKRQGYIFYINDYYRETLQEIGADPIPRAFSFDDLNFSPFYSSLLNCFLRAQYSEKEEAFTAVHGKNPVRFIVEKIGHKEGKAAFKLTLISVISARDSEEQVLLNKINQHLYPLYGSMRLFNTVTNQYQEIGTSSSDKSYSKIRTSVDGQRSLAIKLWAEENVFVDDRQRFINFIDFNTLDERIKGRAFLTDIFRVKQKNGDYQMTKYNIVTMSDFSEHTYLFYRDDIAPESRFHFKETEVESSNIVRDIWNSALIESDLRIFWKDTERRFLGASQSFLDFYGLKSVAEIIGKTDEELQMNILNEPFRMEEDKVLREGKTSTAVIGTTTVKGQLHNIRTSKFPIYHEGKIIGLVGYFIDASNEKNNVKLINEKMKIMNVNGLLETILNFETNRVETGQDYALANISITNYQRYLATYNKQIDTNLLRTIAQRISEELSLGQVLGHTTGANFVLIYPCKDMAQADEVRKKIAQVIQDIHEIDGTPCTLFTESDVALSTDTTGVAAMVSHLKI